MKRSRKKADFWRELDPLDTAHVMLSIHGEGAGAEVLLRAFLRERDLDGEGVQFWLGVYDLCRDAISERWGQPKEAT